MSPSKKDQFKPKFLSWALDLPCKIHEHHKKGKKVLFFWLAQVWTKSNFFSSVLWNNELDAPKLLDLLITC